MNIKRFKELLNISFKSEDTEEWLDVYFTRPIGLVFALLWNRLGIHPNAITILSIILGIAAGWMFHYSDLQHNIIAVVLLMFANFCDSTDGQMARITGKKTLWGRMLDGFASDVWFFCVYVAISIRLMNDHIPLTETRWGLWIWILCAVAGFGGHARQAALADYYRQIHLFFLLGKNGSELNSYAEQYTIYKQARKEHNWTAVAFHYNYANYCHGQEQRTPECQRFLAFWRELPNEQIRCRFLRGSRPLMPYTNILTHNTRAIVLFITALINLPWLYPLFEITVLQGLLVYMRRKHEALCRDLRSQDDTIILFDFGGTLDTHGMHWANFIWKMYKQAAIPIAKEQFREAYIYGERTLGKGEIIQENYTLSMTLEAKIGLQLEHLRKKDFLQIDDIQAETYRKMLTHQTETEVRSFLNDSLNLIKELHEHHRIAIVSNFYGNIHTILKEYEFHDYIDTIVESAKEGIRKPDPTLFAIAIQRLGGNPNSCYVVGDSYEKDIMPAKELGCITIWLKGEGWTEAPAKTPAADYIISELTEIKEIILTHEE